MIVAQPIFFFFPDCGGTEQPPRKPCMAGREVTVQFFSIVCFLLVFFGDYAPLSLCIISIKYVNFYLFAVKCTGK